MKVVKDIDGTYVADSNEILGCAHTFTTPEGAPEHVEDTRTLTRQAEKCPHCGILRFRYAGAQPELDQYFVNDLMEQE